MSTIKIMPCLDRSPQLAHIQIVDPARALRKKKRSSLIEAFKVREDRGTV